MANLYETQHPELTVFSDRDLRRRISTDRGTEMRLGNVELSLKFEPRDLWIGAFWDQVGYVTRVFICLVPMFPICLKWRKDDE